MYRGPWQDPMWICLPKTDPHNHIVVITTAHLATTIVQVMITKHLATTIVQVMLSEYVTIYYSYYCDVTLRCQENISVSTYPDENLTSSELGVDQCYLYGVCFLSDPVRDRNVTSSWWWEDLTQQSFL